MPISNKKNKLNFSFFKNVSFRKLIKEQEEKEKVSNYSWLDDSTVVPKTTGFPLGKGTMGVTGKKIEGIYSSDIESFIDLTKYNLIKLFAKNITNIDLVNKMIDSPEFKELNLAEQKEITNIMIKALCFPSSL